MTRRGQNDGSSYERWDGRWAGSVHIGYEDGKRVRKHVMGHTRAEVKEKMAALLRAHEERRPIPDHRAKVGPFLRRWLDEVAKPTLRASTYDSYDDILKGHLIPGLGHIALARLTPAEVQSLLNRKLEGGALAAPGPVHPRRAAPGARHGGAVGHGVPQRRQARRPAAGDQARDHAAHA